MSRLTWVEKEELTGLVSRLGEPRRPDPRSLIHLVVLPVANEGLGVIQPTLDALLNVQFPHDRLVVCLSFEARCKTWTDQAISDLVDHYRDQFGMLLGLRHPDGLPGEARVKGANISWAAKQARSALHATGVSDRNVVVSAFDCDTRASPEYFSVLAWTFLTDPNRHINCYQPVLLFHNNIWEVPAVSRLVGHCASMWNMGDLTRHGKTQIFASHAIGMEALVHVDYWAINIVPDDSRQYWRLYYGSNGRSVTKPMHIPLYMDSVQHQGYLTTLVEQYLQIRRWSYGVIDLAYIMTQNRLNPQIPLARRLTQTARQLSSFHKRAATPILLLITGHILGVLQVGSSDTVLTHLTSSVQFWTGIASLVSVAIGVVVSFVLLPRRPPGYSAPTLFRFGAEWLLLPIVLPVFFALPALEVHLRIVIRRYIGFRVTVKGQRAAVETPSLVNSKPGSSQLRV